MVNSFVQQVLNLASNPEIQYQILFVLATFLFTYFITKSARRFGNKLKTSDNKITKFSQNWFLLKFSILIYPTLTIFLLSITDLLAGNFIEKTQIINAAQRVSVVWILWVILSTFISSSLVRIITSWILIPAALLQLFGWFNLVVDRLNTYGFKLGEVNITTYTIIKTILFVSIVIWLGNLISNSAETYVRKNKSINRSTRELIIKIFNIFIYAALFLATLNLVGIDLTVLTVFGGAIGVGLGFGLQKIASNFISGIILLTEKSINLDNLVEMDDGTFGYVRKLGARATIIETFDGKEVMIPNEDFITSRVANLTYSSNFSRVDVPIGVSYDTDLDHAKDLILEAANSNDRVTKEDGHKPSCYLREYGDSSINFLLVFWVEDVTAGRWGVQSDLMFSIWRSFKKHNIEIPFPQRDIHIRSDVSKKS
ncbi:MAG: small-conductance mechanosensitive channel [Lentimonas sp.]|jgi:small-conductance mechanosensitive channel